MKTKVGTLYDDAHSRNSTAIYLRKSQLDHIEHKDSSKDSQDFIGGLNAEDEFYELMDNDEIVSASLEMLRGDKMEVVDTWSRDENGKVSIKLGK